MNWKEKAAKRIDAVSEHAANWSEERWAEWWKKELDRQDADQLKEKL